MKELFQSDELILGVPTKYLMFFIVGITLFRALFIPTMGLMPQDAYYFFYSEHLDWSYYDHPPMIAWILKCFSVLGKSAWVVKLTSYTCTTLCLYLFYILAGKFLDRSQTILATTLFASTIMMSILSVISGPDIPLILFWILAMLSLYYAVFENKRVFWIIAGIMMGLSFDGKYTAIFLPACLFCFLVFSKTYRKYLLSPWPYLMGIMMVLAMSPVIYWNYINDFASFGYQTSDRAAVMAEDGWKPEHILGSIGQQSIVLVPILFFVFLVITPKHVYQNIRTILSDDKKIFILSFFFPVFCAFMGLSIMYWVKLNWMMPVYIGGCIYAATFFKPSWLKWQLGISIVMHLALALQVWFYPISIKSDDTWFGWDQLAEEVKEISSEYPEAFLISGDHYKTTAELLFYMDTKVYGSNVFGKRATHFDYIGDDMTSLNGKDAIYIDSDPRFRDLKKGRALPLFITLNFQSIEEIEPIIVYNGDKPVRKFNIYIARDYKFIPWEDKELEETN